ncbi:hypothetical protein M9H77_12531 [Catharanthus roseus]|uniref:Uncharacterized protein n=1 Tax=Catharanthus roseus TaxID=4058 RepID=A0ACC0BHR3_CATRO|nr:hypothetical protein M9H77_12531 [Catharanthus roseus]
MVSDESSMLYSTVNNDDDEVDGSDGDDAVSKGDFQTPLNLINPVNPAVSAVRKYSISVGREYRVLKSKIDTWTAKCYHHSDENYYSWYIRIKKKATPNRWEITIFVKEHTCLVQIEQNKHKNLSSKFISMSISHLVANDPEIPVSNIIQKVQLLRIELKSREHKVTTYNPREGIYMVKSPIRVSGTGNNCVEKTGQEQILMCRRYIRDKRTEELTKRIFIRS